MLFQQTRTCSWHSHGSSQPSVVFFFWSPGEPGTDTVHRDKYRQSMHTSNNVKNKHPQHVVPATRRLRKKSQWVQGSETIPGNIGDRLTGCRRLSSYKKQTHVGLWIPTLWEADGMFRQCGLQVIPHFLPQQRKTGMSSKESVLSMRWNPILCKLKKRSSLVVPIFRVLPALAPPRFNNSDTPLLVPVWGKLCGSVGLCLWRALGFFF